MHEALSVRLNEEPVGVLAQDEHGQLSFRYLPEWIESSSGMAISMAMPLQVEPFGDVAVRTFFEGYLPDDENDLRRIAQHFDVSPNSTFQLVRALGGDLAGALSIHALDDPVVDPSQRVPSFEVLDEAALANLLRSLEREPLGVHPGGLRMSLAGAQSKTAVYVTNDGHIAKTKDNFPTSHIVKPELRADVPDLALIEFLCMELSRAVGLPTPAAVYGQAQGVPYVMIERYDRVRAVDGRISRLHQEDVCQALGLPRRKRYQSDGGPSLQDCFALTNRMDVPAIARLQLLDLVLLNWLVGNTDAHGKNFSVLYGVDGPVLAPVYDVVSVLVYERAAPVVPGQRTWTRHMAMQIGGVRAATDVTPKEWERFADNVGFTWPVIRDRIDEISRAASHAAIAIEKRLVEQSLTTPHFHRAVDLILEHINRLRVKQRLGLVTGLSERLKAVVSGAGTGATDRGAGASVNLRYRAKMAALWDQQDRAKRSEKLDESRRLDQLSHALTECFRTWRSGEALSVAQGVLFEEHVGPLPDRS